MLDPVCNVPVSGESREIKDWPPATFWEPIEERSIWLSREVGRVYTLTQLSADQQTLRKAPKPLVTPVVPLKACWLNRTEMSCYFSQLSAVTDRGEFNESLIPGFPPLLGVGTVDICETLIPGFPPLLGVGTVDICETLIPGFPPLLGVGTVDICCEQPTGMGRNA